jgi:hypothetical protein
MIGGKGFRLANIRWRINKNDWQSAVRKSGHAITLCK